MSVAKAGQMALAARRTKAPRVKIRPQKNSQKPVVTAMTVILGTNGLKYALVQKGLPATSFWVKMAFLGLGLATLQEFNAKFGKTFAYMVMTIVVFAQSQDILKELELLDKQQKKGATDLGTGPGDVPLALAAVRTRDRQPFVLYFDRANPIPEVQLPTRHTPFIDPQRGTRRPAPIPYRGSTTFA